MGIKTTSRSESFNSQIKRAIRIIRRNKDSRIISVFNDIAKDQDESFIQKISIQQGKQLRSYKGDLIRCWTSCYTRHSLNILLEAVSKLDRCLVKKVQNNKIYSVEEHSIEKTYQYTVNKGKKFCSCYKMISHGVPCCHIIYVFDFIGEDMINLFVAVTASRWLLPSCRFWSSNELKGNMIRSGLKRGVEDADGVGIKLRKANI